MRPRRWSTSRRRMPRVAGTRATRGRFAGLERRSEEADMKIDLNCDMGELEDAEHEAALMEHITSANIACGGHAGDEATMERTVRLALERGVRIGAHPGYPDRVNFGRVEMPLSSEE